MGLMLVIGSKKWSSWSLRAWLALKQAGIPFEELVIPLRQPGTKPRILEYSPAGKVPVLIDGNDRVWDSLAILDYLADRFPDKELWPSDMPARALARSIAAEMHAGFPAVRNELPMDVSHRLPTPTLSPEAAVELERIKTLWSDARSRFGAAGPFLFGRFTNADAMYAPVATRLETYGISLDPLCHAYVQELLNLPPMKDWYRAAAQED